MAETLTVNITETMTIAGESLDTSITKTMDDVSGFMKRILKLSNSAETTLWELDSATTDTAGYSFFYSNIVYARITNCNTTAKVYIKIRAISGNDSVYHTIQPTASFILWDHTDMIAFTADIDSDDSVDSDDIGSITAMSDTDTSSIEIFVAGNI